MSFLKFAYALSLVACGSSFSSGDGSEKLIGEGGAAAVAVSTTGSGSAGAGGTSASNSTQGPATSSVTTGTATSSAASSSASTAATTSSSSTAASSSSSGGGGPTPAQLYAMYCYDAKVNNVDDCDAAHANCQVVVAASCAFKCNRNYCVTVWSEHFCGPSGDCLFVGLTPHPNSSAADAVYCCS